MSLENMIQYTTKKYDIFILKFYQNPTINQLHLVTLNFIDQKKTNNI